jgi:phosphatidylserine decarboxylase
VAGKSNPFVVREGIPFLALAAALVALALRYAEWWVALLPIAAFVLLYLLFRDPERDVPPVALGVVSPVDGKVVAVDSTDHCVVQGEAWRVRIRISTFGAYTARSPIEGRVMDLRSKTEGLAPECPANALWVETDEGSSVVLQFHEYRLGIPPQAFVGLGERLGQGQRCARIRLARFAEVYLPIDGKVKVKPGQAVRAGSDLIGAVPHP